MSMKVKIISDGTPRGTKLVNAETGEKLEGVTSVEWHISVDRLSEAVIMMRGVPIEAVVLEPKTKRTRMLRPLDG